MAGVLRDAQGRVLLAQRPPGKHLAGSWEFPGGKREPGETPQQALLRELREELGVIADAQGSTPLIRIPWRYEKGQLCLDAWTVSRWQGEPQSLEGQALRWMLPGEIDPASLAPADRPVLAALRLPAIYAITPVGVLPESADQWRERMLTAMQAGLRLMQLRLPDWDHSAVRKLAADLLPRARELGVTLMLNGDIEGARELGHSVGVQLKSSQLEKLDARPLPWTQTVGASCHDEADLRRASMLSADFALLSPVALTASHPDVAPLGWDRFRSWTQEASLPVYALGGMSPDDLAVAREHGAQGVAGIRGFWR